MGDGATADYNIQAFDIAPDQTTIAFGGYGYESPTISKVPFAAVIELTPPKVLWIKYYTSSYSTLSQISSMSYSPN